MKNTAKKTWKFIFRACMLVIGLLFIGAVSYETWLHTVHTVIPNTIYRSAQLPLSTLTYYTKEKHINTVINMRGSQPTAKWYEKEVNAMRKLGVKHYDISMDSYKLPPKERLRKLAYLLMTSPKPILIHCLGGADRSGLASALATILIGNASLQQSKAQFSLEHFVISRRSVGKLVFPYYTRWLKTNRLQHSRHNFLAWMCTQNPLHQKNKVQHKNLTYYNQLFMQNMCRSAISKST